MRALNPSTRGVNRLVNRSINRDSDTQTAISFTEDAMHKVAPITQRHIEVQHESHDYHDNTDEQEAEALYNHANNLPTAWRTPYVSYSRCDVTYIMRDRPVNTTVDSQHPPPREEPAEVLYNQNSASGQQPSSTL